MSIFNYIYFLIPQIQYQTCYDVIKEHLHPSPCRASNTTEEDYSEIGTPEKIGESCNGPIEKNSETPVGNGACDDKVPAAAGSEEQCADNTDCSIKVPNAVDSDAPSPEESTRNAVESVTVKDMCDAEPLLSESAVTRDADPEEDASDDVAVSHEGEHACDTPVVNGDESTPDSNSVESCDNVLESESDKDSSYNLPATPEVTQTTSKVYV